MADYNGEAYEWLKHLPGYRELIKQRVHEAQLRQRRLDYRLLRRELGPALFDIIGEPTAESTRARTRRAGVDKIGQEVDGCG